MIKRRTLKFWRQRQLFVMLLPTFILATVFTYLPISGWVMAFTDYQLGKPVFSGAFVGLEHFRSFFVDIGDAAYVIRNTLGMNLISLVVNIIVACTFAVFLNEVRNKTVKRCIQTFSFFPFFVSWVIVYMIFNVLLARDSGVLNILLVRLGIVEQGISFMAEPKWAWAVFVFINLWKTIGYNSIIFLSSISGIDQQQYEAATIDGASRIQKIRFITLPALVPTVVILLVMNSGWIFNSNFDAFYLLTNGSNWPSMEVLDMYVYRYGIQLLNFSYATAVSVVKTFASLAMLILVNRIAKRLSGSSVL